MAKKFHFRLEAVRQLRKQTKDLAARRVALRQAATNATAARKSELADRIESEQTSARSQRQVSRLDIAALRMQQYHGKWLGQRLAESSDALEKANAALALERERLGRALAALKGIEKLKARRWQRHLWDLRRQEQAESDEVAGLRGRLGQTETQP